MVLNMQCPDPTAHDTPRTQSQHNALFLWFSMIEKLCEERGITWDRLIRHTHQIRVTQANLHEACKQLQKALWGTVSTKQLKKQEQIDIIIDHFTDWFAKEELELPSFPSRCIKHEMLGCEECICNSK